MGWNVGNTVVSAPKGVVSSAKDIDQKTKEDIKNKDFGGNFGGITKDMGNLVTGGYMGEMQNGLAAAGGSIKNASDTSIGNPAANAWHTSVVDPLHKAGAAVQGGIQHLQDMFNGAYNGLQTPTGPAGMGGGNPMMVGVPGGGGPGGMPAGAVAMPQVTAGIGGDPNNAFRQGQMGLMTQLQGQAAGTGPSIAQNQLKLGQEQALAQSLAMANSARGGANPLMARQAMQQNAMQSGAMANQAANLRLQEQQQAQQALAGLTGQGRAGDLGVTGLQQQGQVSQANIAQAQNELVAKYSAMGLDAQKANQQAMIDLQKLSQEGQLGFAKLDLESQMAQNGLLGGALQGGAGVLTGLGTMFSDKRLKKNIKSGDEDMKEFLDGLSNNTYEYKNKAHGKGEFTSPMAQDLLKSKIGKTMVIPTPEGLAVNYGANPGAILAAQAFIHKRLEKLENK